MEPNARSELRGYYGIAIRSLRGGFPGPNGPFWCIAFSKSYVRYPVKTYRSNALTFQPRHLNIAISY